MISRKEIYVLQPLNFECLCLMLGDRDLVGLLLVYCPPPWPIISLLELSDVVMDVILEYPRLAVLADFRIHAQALQCKTAENFMDFMTIMDLSQVILAIPIKRSHTLVLVFCPD